MADEPLDQQLTNQALLNGLTSLGKKMDELNTTFKKSSRNQSNQAKEFKQAWRPVTGLIKNFGVLIAGVAVITKAITGTNTRLQIAAATNIDVIAQSRKLQEAMKDTTLSQDLVGEAYQTGVRHLSTRMISLAREMKNSGENTQQLFSAFAGFEGSLGFNEKALVRLSGHLDETSDIYQLSTDRLVGALIKLTDTLSPLSLTSGSQETLNAMATVAAKMGTKGMDILQPIMGQIMKAASDPASLARAGAGFGGLNRFVRSMEAGASAQVQAQLLESLIKQGGTRFTGALSDISLSQRAFGTNLLPMLSQAKLAMGNRKTGLPGGETGEPATIESILARLVDPLKGLADEVLPKLLTQGLDLAKMYQSKMKPLIYDIGDWAEKKWPVFKDLFEEIQGDLIDLNTIFDNLKESWFFKFLLDDDKEPKPPVGMEPTDNDRAGAWFAEGLRAQTEKEDAVKFYEKAIILLESINGSSQTNITLLEDQLEEARKKKTLFSSGASAEDGKRVNGFYNFK
jgi:hypothetical protein